jgi:hypothetical protein
MIKNALFRIVPARTGSTLERIEYRKGRRFQPVGRVRYHVRYWRECKGVAKTLRLRLRETSKESLTYAGRVKGLGQFTLEYRLPAGRRPLQVHSRFICQADRPIHLGYHVLAIQPPKNCDALRLMMGTYGGFTRNGVTVLFADAYDERRGRRQLAFAVDQAHAPVGTTQTKYQYLVQSFPPSYVDGVMQVASGEEVAGGFVVKLVREHIWDPAIKLRQWEKLPAAHTIEGPRFALRHYLANWQRYTQEPLLWVQLAADMGMHHVGFYGILSEPKLGGPYGWALNGKYVRYRELYEILFGKRRRRRITLGSLQENVRQLEIGWGNGGNAMVAYAYFLHGKSWACRRARMILNAILGLGETGFQLTSGPLAGAWINAYDADAKQFQDHYGGQQVFLPNQGIVNYFLSRCYLEGHSKDPRIIERIKTNCDAFLSRIEERNGTYPNAFSPDGSAGYSREGYRYDWANAPALALTMTSFLCCHELTGRREYLQRTEDILKRWLAPRIKAFEFGFLEFDHAGWDSAGACHMLVCLGHYLQHKDTTQKALARKLDKLVFEYLMSFRHEHDYFLPTHSQNVKGWGAVAKNKFGFLHGFTPGSSQGVICLHLRYEYGYGLMRAFETNPTPQRYAAFMNYLNYYTYQQFVNPDLPVGFGGCTEHTALETYVQDTTHVIHSTPLAMVALKHWPLFIRQTDRPMVAIRPVKNGLEVGLDGPTRLVADSLMGDHIRVGQQICRAGVPLTAGVEGRKTTIRLTLKPEG